MPFALTPARSIEGYLDFEDSDHVKIFESAIRPYDKHDKFDCEPEGLFQFLNEVERRAKLYGWHENILVIREDPTDPDSEELNFLDNYGFIDLDTIRANETYYIDEEDRRAQDTQMLYQFLMSSITTEARARVNLWKEQFTIDGYAAGVALLKIIVRESYLDTNATTTSIKMKLSNLDEYMRKNDNDISKFNQHVKLLSQALAARGERSSDLLVNLFKGYLACTDEAFKTYISERQDRYDDNELTLTPDSLMLLAKQKFDALVEKEVWNKPSAESQLIALEAKMDGKVKKLSTKLESLSKKPTGGRKGDGKADPDGKPQNWPAPRNLKDKKAIKRAFKGNTYYYCHPKTGGKCDGKWRRHSPIECDPSKFLKKAKGTEEEKASGDTKDKSEKRKVTFADGRKKLKVMKAELAAMERRKQEEGWSTDSSA